jgi:hypothetical protein
LEKALGKGYDTTDVGFGGMEYRGIGLSFGSSCCPLNLGEIVDFVDTCKLKTLYHRVN